MPGNSPGDSTWFYERATWALLADQRPLVKHITVQCDPTHCRLQLNEQADTLANEGSKKDQNDTPCDLNSAEASVHRHVSKTWLDSINHKLYPKNAKSNKEKVPNLCRKTRTVLAQLRCAGYCPILGSYLHRIGASPTSECCNCGAAVDDLNHLSLTALPPPATEQTLWAPFLPSTNCGTSRLPWQPSFHNSGRLKTLPPARGQGTAYNTASMKTRQDKEATGAISAANGMPFPPLATGDEEWSLCTVVSAEPEMCSSEANTMESNVERPLTINGTRVTCSATEGDI